MGMMGPQCQSCGMPMKKDPKGGGTNADGSASTVYCSNCYQAGQFTEPTITAQQMQEKVQGKIREMGFPGFLAKMMAKGVPKLSRWQ